MGFLLQREKYMYKTILVPIDLAQVTEGKNTIDYAIAHRGVDTQVILLHVIEEVPAWVASELPAGIMEKSVQEAEKTMMALAKDAGDDIVVQVRQGHAHNTILQVAEKENADLIILASHKPGLVDYFIGSNAAKVVRHAKCSVLVVR